MCSVAGKTRLTKQEGDGRQENRGPDQLRSRQNLLPTMLPLPKTAFAPPKMLLCFGDPVHPIRLGSYSVSSYCCFVLPATSPREHDTLVFSSFHEKNKKKQWFLFVPFVLLSSNVSVLLIYVRRTCRTRYHCTSLRFLLWLIYYFKQQVVSVVVL